MCKRKEITVIINDFVLPSFNHFYSQKIHFKRRSDMVWKWRLAIRKILNDKLTPEEIGWIKHGKQMRIEVLVSMAKRCYDVDNCTMYGKLFLDALKQYDIDDNPKTINSISYTIDLSKKQNMAVYKIIV